jgi:tetratricopeptide (TPR) repeat protein
MGVFLIMAIIRFAKSKNDANWLLGVGLLAGFTLIFFMKFLYISNLSIDLMSWLMLALLTCFLFRSTEEREISLEASPKLALLLSFLFILVVTFSASGIYLIGQRYMAEVSFLKGIVTSQKGAEGFSEANTQISRAIQLNKYRDSYYRVLAQLYAAQIDKEIANLQTATEDDVKATATRNIQVLIDSAIAVAKQGTEIEPSMITNWDTLAGMYAKVAPLVRDADTAAIQAYDKAITLEPLNPVLYVSQAKVYVTRYDTIKQVLDGKDADKLPNKAELESKSAEALTFALEKLQKAIEIKGNYADAHYQLAMVHLRKGDTVKAIAELEPNRAASPQDVALGLQLGILYYQNKDTDKAITELNRILKLSPNYSNALWYLASIYEAEGDKAKAIEYVQKVVDLNPDNEEVQKKLEALKTGTSRPATELPTPVVNEPEPTVTPQP